MGYSGEHCRGEDGTGVRKVPGQVKAVRENGGYIWKTTDVLGIIWVGVHGIRAGTVDRIQRTE